MREDRRSKFYETSDNLRPGRKGDSLCQGALVLPAGQITLSSYNTVADTPATIFAVTGGTEGDRTAIPVAL